MTQIKNRYTGDIIIEDKQLSLSGLLEKAINKGVNLKNAYLKGAYLKGAYMEGAYLKGAYMEGANMEGANMEGANMEGAYLKGAYLRGAYMEGVNLRGAYMEGVNLKSANLEDANDIPNLFLNDCRKDILYIFSHLPHEVPGLKEKIINGKIDGSQYEGECCCLIGSMGNDKAESAIPYYTKGLHNRGEQLFWQIGRGDTPEDNQFSQIALELCNEFLAKKHPDGDKV